MITWYFFIDFLLKIKKDHVANMIWLISFGYSVLFVFSLNSNLNNNNIVCYSTKSDIFNNSSQQRDIIFDYLSDESIATDGIHFKIKSSGNYNIKVITNICGNTSVGVLVNDNLVLGNDVYESRDVARYTSFDTTISLNANDILTLRVGGTAWGGLDAGYKAGTVLFLKKV